MPSSHSRSSHSSHSSHSSRSSSRSSSSRSHHSSSSHSSRSYRSHSTHHSKPVYRKRSWTPKHKHSKIITGASHDYYYYTSDFLEDDGKYEQGYYDENGNYYEDVQFLQNGQVPADAQVLCVCEFCRTKQIVKWDVGELKCSSCGGSLDVLTHFDEPGKPEYTYASHGNPISKLLLLFLGFIFIPKIFIAIIAAISVLGASIFGSGLNTDYSNDSERSSVSYNTPNLGSTLYLRKIGIDAYEIIDEYEEGCKKLVLDSDGNYYDKETDCYVWLNEDIDPPQFQYYYEGVSSDYGDYGWMEYDPDEGLWYIEVSNGNWQRLDINYDTTKMWYIDYDFYN